MLGPFARNLSEERVDKARHAPIPLVANQLYRVVHDRMRRYPLEMQQLERTCAQDGSHPIIDFDRAGCVPLNCRVQIGNDPKRPVDDLSCKRCVGATRPGPRQLRIERGRCPRPIVRHTIENVHRDSSGLRNHERKLPRASTGSTEIGDAGAA